MRYGIPPAALPSIDPMQLLTLEIVRQAIDDAGYLDREGRELPGDTTSVILGVSGGLGDLGLKYGVRASLADLGVDASALGDRLPVWTEDSFAGILLNVVAGRVANRFNLGGVNYTVDAACASSLAAVYLGVSELEAGTSDAVIVGGVDTVQSPFGYLCFSSSQALSPRGRCRTFDETADGIVISEGLTALVLKRVEDAERDGDRIYAVIKAVAGSSDGRGKSLTAPRPEGQVRALSRAYARAGVSPATVGLIEAHGTGTVVGDAAEVASLAEVFGRAGAAPESCAIGSAKSLVGHTKSAAGVTGLMKVALALKHKVLPPTLHVERPNPRLREAGTPFYVSAEPRPWLAPPDGGPRRAGVSAFGFGGTNFHAVLEEHEARPAADEPGLETWPAELLLWESGDAAELNARLGRLQDALGIGQAPALRDLAAAVCAERRTAHGGEARLRLAIVAADVAGLVAKLGTAREALAAGRTALSRPAGVYLREAGPAGKVAWLFPGQGSQAPGMLGDLALAWPHLSDALAEADRVLDGALGRPLGAFVYPPPSFSDDERQARMAALTDTVVAQPALGAVEVGLARLLADFGLRPDMAAGHSYGEYVALWAAGVFDADTLFRLSHVRGRIIKDSVGAQPGAMAAVSADAGETARAIEGLADVWVANLNAPRQTIIAGAVERVDEALAALERQGLRARRIPVACAFHSPLMETARGRLSAELAGTPMRAPRFPVFSNAEAAPYASDPDAIARQLSEHLVRPVRFVDEILAMHDAGARVFVEIGPRSVLTGLARDILKGRDATIVAADAAERSALTQLLHVLGQLASAGHAVDADRLFHGRASRLDLAAVGRSKEAKPAPGWVVTGGGARRAGRPAAATAPAAVSSTGPVAPARAAGPAAAPAADVSAAEPFVTGGTAVAERGQPPSAIVPPAATPDEVMLRYQTLMTQFLETQASVMTAYLQGGGAADAAVPRPAASAVEMSAAPASVVETPAPAAVPVAAAAPVAAPQTAAPAPAAAPAATDAAAELLQVVSDRTGYPIDMLGLDLNIEADLGIDSIKRVEILSATQRRLPADVQTRVQASMDTLTGFKTLRQIGDALAAMSAEAPVEAPEVPEASDAGDVEGRLLRIASDRTGYPVEMLGLDLNIEADLGIDSIKRVEILSAFQRQSAPADRPRVQALMDRLASLKTFRQILDAVADAPVPDRAGTSARPVAPAARLAPAPAVSRFTLTAVERPLEVGRPSQFPGRLTVIADDGAGAGAAVAQALEAAGERAVRLTHHGLPSGEGAIAVDLTSAQAVAGALDAVRRTHGSIGAVVHLVSLAGDRDLEAWSMEEWRERVQRDIKSLYCLARATADDLAARGREAGAALVAVTAMDGAGGAGPVRDLSPSQGGVAAFVRTLAQEWPDVACRAVDVRADAPATEVARFVRAELGGAADTVDVGYGPGARTALVPAVSPLNGGGRDVLGELDEHAVVLVTGGARGITAEIATALARRLRPTLVIAGRTPRSAGDEPATTAALTDAGALRAALAAELRRTRPDVRPAEIETTLRRLLAAREVERTLAALEAIGARVEYHQIDVRDAAAFGALIDDIYRRHGRLDGVVHGAGVIEDKLLQDKTADSFDRVLHTKADSAFTLVRHLRPDGLRLLVFMSSVTATFGNRGQADYGAANGVMNALASWCAARWPARVVAVNWGPWDSAGMASPEIRAQFVARGIQPIPLEAGVKAFMKEVGAGAAAPPVVVIGDGPWSATAVAPGVQELHA